MNTALHRITLTFRCNGAIEAVFIRKGPKRRRYEIRARFDEYGWRQWGEPSAILSDNICAMNRIRTILGE